MESRPRLESFLPLVGFPTRYFYEFQPLIESMLNSVQYDNNSSKNDRTKKLNLYAYLCITARKPAKF